MDIEKLFLLKKPLRKAMDGHLFDTVFGWVLRIAAFVMVVALVLKSVDLWSRVANAASGQYLTASLFFEVLVAQLVYVGIYYAFMNILWLRGSDVLAVEHDPDYNATPILVIVLKGLGECLAVYILGIFTIAGLSVWMGGTHAVIAPIMGILHLDFVFALLPINPFLLGLEVLVFGPILSIIALMCVYAVTEFMGAVVSIAKNTEKK